MIDNDNLKIGGVLSLKRLKRAAQLVRAVASADGYGEIVCNRALNGHYPVANSPKWSMVTEPVFWSPIPAERLVAPEGTAGVVQVACVQEPLLVNVGDCVQ